MRFHTYTKHSPQAADAVDLESLLEKLADFLLQSGFAGGPYSHPYWGDFGGESDRTLEALKEAILRALLESGEFTPEMLAALRGANDPEAKAKLSQLLDDLVRRLAERGYLNVDAPPRVDDGHQPVIGPGSLARAASRDVEFKLTEKGLDFLAYRTLRQLLGTLGRSSVGSHDTPHLATGVEADAWSKQYEFGDTMNLDVSETLKRALTHSELGRDTLDLEWDDLMVRQTEYRSSCATVLMLDTSHSMILYGEDRFTPAKKVALALTHLIATQYPGDSIRVLLFHDSAEEIPLGALAQAQVGPYHTNTAEGLKLARRLLLSQRKDMRQIIMITDGKPSALTQPDGRIYKNAFGLDPFIVAETCAEVAACRKSGIMINTFMLARDYDLVSFVRRVAEICKGKAYFTTPYTLGQYVLMDYMDKKTKTIH